MVYASLITSEEIFQVINQFNMHICLRPELTYEENQHALNFAKKVKSVRWLPASGTALSTPLKHSGQWNNIKYLPETMGSFFAPEFEEREPAELMRLVLSNWARLLFSKPMEDEKENKKDIWADFDPDEKFF